ncbi:MAG: N-acetylmuramoyl-L-alanine amidase [Romboutsia timonensis]
MANRRNNRKSRRNKKRRINKKKLTLLFIVVILFIAGAFKLTQGAISTIKNTSNNKKQTSVVESSNNEYENLPTEVDKNINKKYTILIDPGHGGNDKGTIANDKITCEKDITLKVGALVAQKLTKQKDVQVIISRNEDKYVSLADRAKLANEQGVDALVSIHLNGQTGGTDAFGLETYYTKEKNDGSYELAKQIQETITSYIDVRDRGLKPERFQVLLQSKMPAVLIECGFLYNDEEAKKLKDEAYQESLAEGIAQGILTYLDTNSKK